MLWGTTLKYTADWMGSQGMQVGGFFPILRLTKKPQSTLPWKACIEEEISEEISNTSTKFVNYKHIQRLFEAVTVYTVMSYVVCVFEKISLWPWQDQWLATATRGVHSSSAGRGGAVGEIAGASVGSRRLGFATGFLPQMLHGAGRFTYIYPKNGTHVGKYSSIMEHLGRCSPGNRRC